MLSREICWAMGLLLMMMTMKGASAEPGPIHYDAAFFTRFDPRTALDMVRQVPGFTLREVPADRRGFSGAASNLLIDGTAPSAKSQTAEDILQRIPATQVVRIEVLRGTESGEDAAGDAMRVNIVRTPSAGAGVWSGGFEYAHQHQPAPNGFLSWSGRVGKLDYGLGASGYSLKRELPATRYVRDASGDLLQVREETSPRDFDEYAINGEISNDVLGGRLRATGQWYSSGYEQANMLEDRNADGAFVGDEFAPYSENKSTTEFGAHFDVATRLGSLAMAGIVTRGRVDSDAGVTDRNAAHEVLWIFQQRQVRETGETIARATLERPLGKSQQLQFGIEGARNALNADLDLTGTVGGVTVPIDVPNARMRVAERRGDAYVEHTWRGARWSSQTRLGGEYSQLDFSGDVRQTVELAYFKPSLQLARAIGGRHQMRVRLARQVDQLDFNDFASAVSLSDELVDGGNPNLRPETSSRLELALDFRFDQAAASARVFHYWLSDVVDLVPLDTPTGLVAAPGNIGQGEVDGLQLTLAVPLSPLLPGGKFSIDTTLQQASVTDPLTGRKRTPSAFERNKLKVDLRQDTRYDGLAWGIQYARESSLTDYRLDQTDRTRESPSLDFFIERNAFAGTKLRFSVISIQGSPELRTRTFHEGNRVGALTSVEETRRRTGTWFMLTFSGSIATASKPPAR